MTTTRRKEVGRKIKEARRKAQHTSQEAFAAAIGKHESSVANAERGSDRVGDAVYEAIEDGIDWPAGSITAYINGTGPRPWEIAPREPAPVQPEPPAHPAESNPSDGLLAEWTSDEIARIEGMSLDQIEAEGRSIGRFSGDDARARYLHDAAVIKLRRAPESTRNTEKSRTLGS
ncbi:helix-turn-helix domain-containing protein [Amycolatopsis roodepoortensis]|uniref:helix-turn-helix domain-containing protein n=1 Tax=Amycolatopsis roodepoortensis TaxID=700274 RepID=UPI00214D01A8|nr:helix-turn-helix transcriptional regulator [Amycolatopsis roodepoortensis]UUV29110.1 helix-turn-helix domain-containing protein [Amycolatopsis roodepoortensis]